MNSITRIDSFKLRHLHVMSLSSRLKCMNSITMNRTAGEKQVLVQEMAICTMFRWQTALVLCMWMQLLKKRKTRE